MRLTFRRIVIAIMALFAYVVHAETLLSTSELLATTPSVQAALPPAKGFQVTSAGTYALELADAGFPAPVASVRAVIVHEGESVAQVELEAGESGTDTFAAVPGEYRIHVLGQPAAGQPAASYSVRVRNIDSGTTIVDEAGSITAAASPSDTTFVALLPVQIAATGQYSLSIVDHLFPAAMQSVEAIVLKGSTIVTGLTSAPLSFTANETGEYLVGVMAKVAPGAAGLYGVKIQTVPSNQVVYESVQQVGTLNSPVALPLTVQDSYTLVLSDANFPEPLSSFRVLIVQGSQVLHAQTGPTTGANFPANAGEIKIYASVVPNGNAGVGSLALKVMQGANPVYANVLIGDADPSSATPSIYAVTSSALSAGAYKLHVKDFGFTANLSALRAAVAQGDALLDDWTGDGQFTFNASAGAARILIAATPSASTNIGLFGIRLEPEAGGSAIVESNQGIGGLFRTHVVTVASAGSRDIELTDLGFPAELATSALAVTSGTTLVGQVFGGGQLRAALNPGTYVLNFLGKPDSSEKYGAYALKVEDSPAPPSLTFTANPSTVASGKTTTLQWTAANADSCTASGAWSGAQNVSGSFVTGTLSTATTFQLSCSGPGGSVEKSVDVQVSSAGKKSGGGGGLGMLDCLVLMAMLGLFLASGRNRWTLHSRADRCEKGWPLAA